VAGFRSVVEDVPADGAPALLIVENEFTDSGREVRPLPLAFLGPSTGSVVGWDASAGRPDGVRRSAQVMGGDVSHRNRLARRQCGELRWIGHPAGRGVRLESGSVCVTHTHLTVDPGPADIDSLAGSALTWLMILEQMQHVLGAQEGPVSQQLMVFIRQSPPRRTVISRGSRSFGRIGTLRFPSGSKRPRGGHGVVPRGRPHDRMLLAASAKLADDHLADVANVVAVLVSIGVIDDDLKSVGETKMRWFGSKGR
jgi:hypothetical protein